MMIKTQIQLEDWQYSSLKRTGTEAGRSLSDVIRESVSLFLKTKKKTEMTPLQELAGKYSSRSMEDLKAHDRAWAESIR
jgi:predicted CopG family antitoxin